MANKQTEVVVSEQGSKQELRKAWQQPTLSILSSATTESAIKDNNPFESDTYTSVGS
ncbi:MULTISPECIES: hypothetical protein [Idiomarina]|uniref:hypothetical protein n=1 Tax=Idiomarina TaxID=135575 RepID=UPI00129D0687|nr:MULTISPECIES: hypothetical protein [Idiomarina]MRJ42971.1 hypothetical protein [Idiomarina sp. FeN1]NCU58523.1 hypothetical protein [Idiomarina sp. FenA--70]NCU61220.1 hypothetical protein [Idiomarina sp. FenBw--71]UUN12720.1 hypothetical protein KGF88_08635 [Idiomarina loihiensis]